MFAKILVPLDGSELAESVLPCAEEIVASLGSKLVLLHVAIPGDSRSHMLRVYLDHTAGTVRHQLAQRRKGEKEGGKGREPVKVKGSLRSGNPAEEILRYAEKNEIDLIAMATHGRSGISRWVLGSVADRIKEAADTPVLLLRAQNPPGSPICPGAFARILVPLDGTAWGEACLPVVQGIASRTGAEIILFQAIHDAGDPTATSGQAAGDRPPAGGKGRKKTTETASGKKLARLRADAQRYLEARAADLEGLNIKCHLVSGDLAEATIASAVRFDADLIAMPTHGRKGIDRWIMGSIADRVLHGSDRPVLLVRVKD
ncbi:MAG: universal stress protein [Dehalococcoidia bacterium]